MRLLTGVWDALTLQQRDPVTFLHAMRRYPHKVWWPAWGIRIAALGAMVIILAVSAWPIGGNNKAMIGAALLFPLFVQMLCGFAISVLGEAQFWLLYAYSPPIVGMALCCGLGTAAPFWKLVGLQIAFPFCVGKWVADAGTLWVNREVEKLEREEKRRRAGGIPATLPQLLFWRRMRLMRWIATGLLSAVTIYLYPALAAQSLWGYPVGGTATRIIHMILSMAAGAAGCLGLDATLLALLARHPPIRPLASSEWRVTYVGRSAMLLPAPAMAAALANAPSFAKQSTAVLSLLRHSALAPSVRRAVAGLPAQHIHALLLHLSLQKGGGEAIRYITAPLPAPIRSVGTLLANLAIEASKPPDLQRWINLLDTQLPAVMPNAAPLPALVLARNALLMLKPDVEVTAAMQALQQGVMHLEERSAASPTSPSTEPGALTWPIALVHRLEQHQKRLQTP